MSGIDQTIRDKWISFIMQLQDDICNALNQLDPTPFREDTWERPEGGGGRTRVIANGTIFEKGGVNTSVVHGEVTDMMRSQLKINGHSWFACGLSLVIHPNSPHVPTVHCNYRMFELYDDAGQCIDRWFGGGTDLTPYYLDKTDARLFHSKFREACDKTDPHFYVEFKKECDNYFVNTHRNNERRGIGGIFYDYRRATDKHPVEDWFKLAHDCGYAFMETYIPIVAKQKDKTWTEAEKYWQEIRRGRYVEFNLVHDRGTIFGLKTNGRIESILMSLPATVRFEYDQHPEPGSREAELLDVCLHPREWIS
jgi:coproporphyrinogen III oxidase